MGKAMCVRCHRYFEVDCLECESTFVVYEENHNTNITLYRAQVLFLPLDNIMSQNSAIDGYYSW